MNIKAVDQTLEHLHEVQVEKVTQTSCLQAGMPALQQSALPMPPAISP